MREKGTWGLWIWEGGFFSCVVRRGRDLELRLWVAGLRDGGFVDFFIYERKERGWTSFSGGGFPGNLSMEDLERADRKVRRFGGSCSGGVV